MGFFQNLVNSFGSAVGAVDDRLLANGLLGRADVLGVEMSGMTVQIMNGLVERKCTFTLQVYLDGEPPYEATVVQRVPEIHLPRMQPGQAVVAVRVDPDDRSRVAIDFASEVPTVTLAAQEGRNSAAWILEHGAPVTVVLVGSQPIGAKSAAGDDVHALTLTVATGVDTPYQVQVGNGVPASALPLLFPGSRLHARVGDGPNDVVVDWAKGAAN